MEIIPYLYFDNVYYGNNDYKNLFHDPNGPQTSRLDTLRPSLYLRENRSTNGGVQMRLQKMLPVFKTTDKRLEWNPGLGYRHFDNFGAEFDNARSSTGDTTKPMTSIIDGLDLEIDYLDFYSSLTIDKSRDGLHLFFGFGLQLSVPLKVANIVERYNTRTWNWNSSTQRWNQVDFTRTNLNPRLKTFTYSVSLSLQVLQLNWEVAWNYVLAVNILMQGGLPKKRLYIQKVLCSRQAFVIVSNELR
jgi:hypothetical protein